MITAARITEIANSYYNDVYTHCLLRLGNDYDASDVTQEVFLLLQKKYSQLNDIHIKAWLHSAADYKIKEHLRAMPEERRRSFSILIPIP